MRSEPLCFSAVRTVLYDLDSVRAFQLYWPPQAAQHQLQDRPYGVFKAGIGGNEGKTCEMRPLTDLQLARRSASGSPCFPQNILCIPLAVLIFLLYLIFAFSPALYAWRISTPSKQRSLQCRKSSSSSLHGVSCCHPAICSQSPHFVCICQDGSGPRSFDGETFPHSTQELFQTKKCPHLFSRSLLLDQRPPL